MGLKPEFDLKLVLDSETQGDHQAMAAVTEAFPTNHKPEVAGRLQESVEGVLPYLALYALWKAVPWAAKKVIGPPLDEIGIYLRVAVKAYAETRGKKPNTALLVLASKDVTFEVTINTDALIAFANSSQQFGSLERYLNEGILKGVFQNAEKVTVFWDSERECWRFYEIWPRDLGSTGRYLVYDPDSGQWRTKRLR